MPKPRHPPIPGLTFPQYIHQTLSALADSTHQVSFRMKTLEQMFQLSNSTLDTHFRHLYACGALTQVYRGGRRSPSTWLVGAYSQIPGIPPGHWTPTRDSVLARLYPGRPIAEILHQVNSLPGPVVSRQRLDTRVRELGLQLKRGPAQVQVKPPARETTSPRPARSDRTIPPEVDISFVSRAPDPPVNKSQRKFSVPAQGFSMLGGRIK
jgi:hypothetical protein